MVVLFRTPDALFDYQHVTKFYSQTELSQLIVK